MRDLEVLLNSSVRDMPLTLLTLILPSLEEMAFKFASQTADSSQTIVSKI